MATDRYVKVGGKSCLHPLPLYQSLEAAGLPTPFWGLASSIHCPVGMEPGSAWFLLSRTDGQALSKNSFQSIAWTDGGTTTTFQKYCLHRGILMGLDGDGTAPYLVELRDKRQVLKFASINKEYNIRRTTRQGDSGTTDLFYTNSLNSGSPWTWQGMFNDIWGNLPSAIRGTAPTLAYTPVNQPEGFRFHGSAWDAIGEVLAATFSTLCLDPINDTFTVQRLGATQTGLSTAQSTLNNNRKRLRTATPLIDLNLAQTPETIRFFFPKRFELDYSLFDVAAASGLVNPYHTIDKTTGLTGAQAGTVLAHRTRYIAEVDADGSTINNSSTLDTLAAELKDKITNMLDVANERGHDVYGGIQTTVKPGCEIHLVVWRDFGDEEGCVTELIRLPQIAHPISAAIFQQTPFTGEILVKNTSGGAYSADSSAQTYAIMKDRTNTSGQTLTADNIYAVPDGKRGAAAVINGTIIVSPQEQ